MSPSSTVLAPALRTTEPVELTLNTCAASPRSSPAVRSIPALPPEMVKSEGFWIEPLTLASDTPAVPEPPSMLEARLKSPLFLNRTEPVAALAVAFNALI